MKLSTLEISVYLSFWLAVFFQSLYSLWRYSNIENNTYFLEEFSALDKGWFHTYKDAKNTQWSLVSYLISLQPKFCLFLVANILIHKFILLQYNSFFELLLSICTLSLITSPFLILGAAISALFYSICGYAFRSKFFVWIMLIMMFTILDACIEEIFSSIYNETFDDKVEYIQISSIQSALALILIRSASLGLDHANTPGSFPCSIIIEKLTFSGILEALCYILYPPNFLFGPIVSFSDWCLWRKFHLKVHFPDSLRVPINFHGCLTKRTLTLRQMLWRILRLLTWFILWEIIIHLVYPFSLVFALTRPSSGALPPPPRSALHMTDETPFHSNPRIQIDRSALGVSVYLIGLQFFFTYLQLYGWPAIFSDTQILLASRVVSQEYDEKSSSTVQLDDSKYMCLIPDGPTCPTHVFLFSEMWRNFDRGLYNFLKWYIYLPLIKFLSGSSIPSLTGRLLGGLFCFTFVLTFHSWNSQNGIWVAINIVQMFSERFVRWIFYDTSLGLILSTSLSTSTLRRITGVLCSFSAMSSSIGFFFFYLGSEAGAWIAYWMLLDPVYPVMAIGIYYCTYQLSVEARRICGKSPCG